MWITNQSFKNEQDLYLWIIFKMKLNVAPGAKKDAKTKRRTSIKQKIDEDLGMYECYVWAKL